jgi:polar amino acid transport system substrate-binding protein
MLAAPVPENVESWQASYMTLCAIAMQAVRQADPQIGERVLVVGQGLIGLLVNRAAIDDGAVVQHALGSAGKSDIAFSPASAGACFGFSRNLDDLVLFQANWRS